VQKLRKAFEEAFGVPFSTCPLPAWDLFPIGEDELLFGSEKAVKIPILLSILIRFSFPINCQCSFNLPELAMKACHSKILKVKHPNSHLPLPEL
jgi:hypothetical protein